MFSSPLLHSQPEYYLDAEQTIDDLDTLAMRLGSISSHTWLASVCSVSVISVAGLLTVTLIPMLQVSVSLSLPLTPSLSAPSLSALSQHSLPLCLSLPHPNSYSLARARTRRPRCSCWSRWLWARWWVTPSSTSCPTP